LASRKAERSKGSNGSRDKGISGRSKVPARIAAEGAAGAGADQGRRAWKALETLAFTKKGVAPLVEKVLRSALQNANYLSARSAVWIWM
jgi:ribosomal protein L22